MIIFKIKIIPIIMNNIQVLENEIYERIDTFLKGKMDDERWLKSL